MFIGTKEDPLYTEDMTWEGRQDKMAQVCNLRSFSIFFRLCIIIQLFEIYYRKPIKVIKIKFPTFTRKLLSNIKNPIICEHNYLKKNKD